MTEKAADTDYMHLFRNKCSCTPINVYKYTLKITIRIGTIDRKKKVLKQAGVVYNIKLQQIY